MTKIVQLNQKSDKELVEEFRAGKVDVSILYRRYSNLVFGSCLKYFRNKPDADDAVSEIFALVSEKLKTHKVENFKSWLYTVTKNYCIEVLRKKNRHRDKISTAESMYSDVIFHPDNVENEEVLNKLEKCIEALPPKQRQTVDMFYFQKVSYKLIAEKMGISWDKVRSFMQNGRRNLRICLDQK